MGTRAVLFDAVGTVFTVREAVGTTYARIASAHGLDVDPVHVETGFRRALVAAPPLAFPGIPPDERAGRERGWWRTIVAAALAAAGARRCTPALFEAIFAHYAGPHAWRLYDDVLPALRLLRVGGYRLGLVSNFDARIVPVITGLGLGAAFDTVVFSTAVGAAKPARAIFARALGMLASTPRDAVHVGDDLRADVRGAHAIGIHPVLLRRGGIADRAPGVSVIHRLDQLPPLVRRRRDAMRPPRTLRG